MDFRDDSEDITQAYSMLFSQNSNITSHGISYNQFKDSVTLINIDHAQSIAGPVHQRRNLRTDLVSRNSKSVGRNKERQRRRYGNRNSVLPEQRR
jgi:hypothetical protein